jgi:hypothetical protein
MARHTFRQTGFLIARGGTGLVGWGHAGRGGAGEGRAFVGGRLYPAATTQSPCEVDLLEESGLRADGKQNMCLLLADGSCLLHNCRDFRGGITAADVQKLNKTCGFPPAPPLQGGAIERHKACRLTME